MDKAIQDLIEISRYYGNNKAYTIGGGGNTSVKNGEHIWVKASGSALGSITEDGFAQLYRDKLKVIKTKNYVEDIDQREKEVLKDLMASRVYPEKNQRPSVETSFHEIIGYKFVIHMHPTMTNALMSANNSIKLTAELFGEEAMYVGYGAGYNLFMMLIDKLDVYRKKFKQDPKLIFLENHGVFVSADTTDEVKELYDLITERITSRISNDMDIEPLPIKNDVKDFVPGIRMKLSEGTSKVVTLRNNTLIASYAESATMFHKISLPFIPDMIVYCKAKYMYIEDSGTPENILKSFNRQLERFVKEYGYNPKIIVIKGYGVLSVNDTLNAADLALDVYEDLIKVSHYSQNFGGPRFMSKDDIDFIDSWEVEKFRSQMSMGTSGKDVVANKIAIVTGGAQGFGQGIVEDLFANNANVVVADLNEEKGKELVAGLNAGAGKNQALFVKTDVSNMESLDNLMAETVKKFGGLDVYISNAGILKAGGLEDMSPEHFDLVTKINYNAYFYGVKYASSIMKLQSEYNAGFFMDIIQINSKSGLKGSNKNFAYAGGKFGGIGLTQSFAMELMPHKIKVNSICPGNFFDGPLWSHPDTGLFVQYLKAGKVPGAKSIEEVKKYYENMVPAGRGCEVRDVMKAVYYVINQEYETGQAVPVTGGQEMLR